MATTPKVLVVDAETGTEQVRAMTGDEQAQHKADLAAAAVALAAQQEREAARAALLERLGITADEAKLLLS